MFGKVILVALLVLSGCITQVDRAQATENDEIYKLSEINISEGIVVIDFMATWCSPCRTEMNHLKKIYNEYGDRIEIISVGIDSRESAELLVSYRKGAGCDWKFAIDDIGLSNEYIVRRIPTVIILNDGELQKIYVGVVSSSTLRREIKELLGE